MSGVAAIVGPTGSGKSAVAMALAAETGAVIVSVDSMQVYRGMDIGTAKPSRSDRARVPHHMVDIVDPSEAYSVAEFRLEARRVMAEATEPVLIVGGSGLHFRSLVDPLDFAPTDAALRETLEAADIEELTQELLEGDPDAEQHVDLANPRRVIRAVEVLRLTGKSPSERAASPRALAVRSYEAEVPVCAVGLDSGEALGERVERRLDQMLAEGFLDEVSGLMGLWGPTAAQAVGYRELSRVVTGEWSLEQARKRSIDATTALARRQRTYFRRDPRVQWQPWDDDAAAVAARALAAFREAGWTL